MPYVTSVERTGLENDMQQSLQQGEAVVERLLFRRFGPLADTMRDRLRNGTPE